MGKFEELLFEAEAVSSLMVQMAHDDVGDTEFAVMTNLGENGTEYECDLGVSEAALRASAVIIALLAELEEKDKRIAELSVGKVGNALLERENHHVEVVDKMLERIAELEEDKLRLNSVINSEANRADAAEHKVGELWKGNVDLLARLATPVRLPDGLAKKIKVIGYYEALNEMMDCVRAAGFKCVGDE